LPANDTATTFPAERGFGADRIAPKRWLAVYAIYILALVVLTIFIPARYRVLTIGLTYLSLATTLIPLNVTAGVLFMASGASMPNMLNWLFGSPEASARVFGTTPPDYSPILVALLASMATVMANLADYHAIAWFMRVGKVRRLARTKFYERIAAWFSKAPFFIVLMINLLAVPFGVDRLLAAPRGYHRGKFALAVFLGRFPRYIVVALVGRELKLDWWQIILICVGIGVALFLAHRAKGLIFRKKPSAAPAEPKGERAAVCTPKTGR
jgi:membrane protein YqaA with SNARE-associated domain